MTYYPFDKQTCEIVIENWSYESEDVDLFLKGATVNLEVNLN